jgi:hypothetical protein
VIDPEDALFLSACSILRRQSDQLFESLRLTRAVIGKDPRLEGDGIAITDDNSAMLHFLDVIRGLEIQTTVLLGAMSIAIPAGRRKATPKAEPEVTKGAKS